MSDAGSDRTAALRPLWAAADRTAGLRAGNFEGEAERTAILDIAEAVDGTLRRLLRDAPEPPLPVRLRALDRDELRADEVLAELRQHDLISLELAAAVHELFETRVRLAAGNPTRPGDRPLAVRAVDRLEAEASTPSPPPPPLPPPTDPNPDPAPAGAGDATLLHPAGKGAARPSTRRVAGLLGALVLLAVIVLGALRLFGGGGDGEMDRGIALFRSGAYADAAAHFWRYSQENPEDATPHLFLARIHRRMNRPDLAGPELRAALRLAPEDAGVQAEVGLLLLDGGQFDLAIARFRNAIRLDADAAEAWIGLVRALQLAGRDTDAAQVLERAPERVREQFARRAGGAGAAP